MIEHKSNDQKTRIYINNDTVIDSNSSENSENDTISNDSNISDDSSSDDDLNKINKFSYEFEF